MRTITPQTPSNRTEPQNPPASRRDGPTATKTITRRPFPLGQLFATSGALEVVHPEDKGTALMRHMGCDWGDCGEDDWAENDSAVDRHQRLFSAYHDRNGTEFWIITEADRSVTTILLPDEY